MYVTHCGKMHMDEISSKENVTSSEIYRGGWSKMHRKTCGTDSAYLAPTSTMIFTSHPIKSFQKFCFWHVLDNFCRRRSDPLRSRSNTSKKFSAELWSLRALKNSPETLSFHPLFNVLLFQNV